MRRMSGFVLGVMLAAVAQAQSADRKPLTPEQYRMIGDDLEYWRQQRERYAAIWRRALELRPDRRNTPLRELNINDNEIREVQAIAARHLPRALVNISPVVTDCPCEEGPLCSAQVYVLATAKGKTSGLQLSRMKQLWQVGIVQAWWLKRNAIQRQHTGNAYLDDYLETKASNESLEEYPVCMGKLEPARQTASASASEAEEKK